MNIKTKSTLVTATFLAIVCHGLLLLLSFSNSVSEREQSTVISVKLQKEVAKLPEIEPEPLIKQDVLKPEDKLLEESLHEQSLHEEQKITPVDVITKTTVPAETDKTKNQSIRLTDFKNFIAQDAKDYVDQNQQKMNEVDQTFNYTANTQESVNVSNESVAQLRHTGVGMSIDETGKRTCYGVIYNLTEPLADPNILSKDCTPEKKFVLDLNAPNNG